MKSGARGQGTAARWISQPSLRDGLACGAKPNAEALGYCQTSLRDAAGRAARGFTLIEFIGSLAVIALLASAMFPVVIRQIDRAAKTAETQNLQAISSNFVAYVRSTATIPTLTGNGWATAVATYMNQPVSGITTTTRAVARLCMYDNSGWLGNNGLTYPYTQTAAGFTFTPGTPGLARVLIVSSIDAKNKVPNLVSTDFQATWAWDPAVNPTLPGGNWANWPGSGYDVVIQRISLDSLFHRVLLSTTNNATAFAYSINGNVGAGTGKVDHYYIDGSILGLYTSGNALQTTELITSDFSRYYLGTQWSDEPGPGPPSQTQISLDNLAALFAGSPSSPSDPRGDNTYGAAGGLIAYMTAYASWASMSPCFSYGGSGNNSLSPQYNAINTVITCFQTGNGGGKGSGSTSGCQIVPLK